MNQAEDRAHRLGQLNAVNIWNFVAKNTIDDMMLGLIDKKRHIFDQAIEGYDAAVDQHILNDLLKEYMTKLQDEKA